MSQKLHTIADFDDKRKDQNMPFLSFAFRPLFLGSAIFSVIALVIWAGVLTGYIKLAVYGGSFWWHMHEMLFGFVVAIIAGFLLTAVQTWTGQRAIHGVPLLLLVLLWLFARIFMLYPGNIPNWIIATIDISFLPIVAFLMARSVIKVKQWRNILFAPILIVMALINAQMHLGLYQATYLTLNQNAFVMVMLVTLLMTVMGGRVFPMFTANGTKTAKVNPIPWLEKAVLLSTVMLVLCSLNVIKVSPELVATFYLVAAILHTIRVLRWRIWVTCKTPLLWSLHLSYWAIPVAFYLFAISLLSDLVNYSQALHTLTVGAMGLMILSMISRVSLGHTGRMIIVGRIMEAAFVLLFCGFMIRVFASFLIDDYLLVILLSAFCWIAAFLLFIWQYFPVLTRAKL